MSQKLLYLISFILVLALGLTVGVANAQWVTYNDMYDYGETAALGLNVTINTFESIDAPLMNFETGALLPVTITGEMVGIQPDVFTAGDNCNAGTDAGDAFNGILSLNAGSEVQGAPPNHKTIIFNNLVLCLYSTDG